MRKIAIIISSLGGGGTQQYINSLVNYLVDKNIEVFIYLTDYLDNKVEIKKAKIRNLINERNGFLRNLILIFSLRKQLKKDLIDNAISFLPKINCISSLANIGLNSSLTVCERNDPIKQKIPFFWSILRLISYNFADNITANSYFALEILKNWFPCKKNFFYTQNFIRNEISKNYHKAKLIKHKYKYMALAVGRLTLQKNYQELIRSFSYLSYKDIGLTIIGSGPLKNDLQELIFSLGLENQVSILPFKKNIYNWFKTADLHIMTSLYEGSPNVLWEASYFSIPSIVSSNINVAQEMLEDKESVLVYESGEEKLLAEKIKLLISNKKINNSIGKKANESLLELSSESVFDIWLKILNII